MLTIQDLPNELLISIFSWGTCNWATLHRYSLPFPVTASSVCVHWRTVALNTPTLWTYVVVPFLHPNINAETWASYWIEKSQPYPVHICLNPPETSSHSSIRTGMKAMIRRVVTVMTDNMARIQRLEIGAYSAAVLGPLAHTPAPILESMYLCFYGGRPTAMSSVGTKLLRDAPKLSKVHLQGASVLLPATNLTHLTLHRCLMPREEIQRLFSTCLKLSHLVLLELLYIPEPEDEEVASIDASSLRYLAVSLPASVSGAGSTPLQYLIMPNLEYLEINSAAFNPVTLKHSLNPTKIRTLRLTNFKGVFSVGENTRPNIEFVQSFINLERLQLIQLAVLESDASFSLINPQSAGPLENDASLSFLINSQLAMPLENDASLSFLINPQSARPNTRRHSISTSSLTNTRHQDMLESFSRNPSMNHIWPALVSIALDTFVPGDVAHLCTFVAAHPAMQLVKLSAPAKRHLVGGNVKQTSQGSFRPRLMREKPGTGQLEVFEWLKSRVKVADIDASDFGLIDKS